MPPTARAKSCPLVAAQCPGGKGVLMPTTKEETIEALKQVMVDRAFGAAGEECAVEECTLGMAPRSAIGTLGTAQGWHCSGGARNATAWDVSPER